MSGHSKWSTIKHRKGSQDARRGRLFSKIIKEISVSVRMGGGDRDSNPQLRAALVSARVANMPKENIERAIKKGLGETGGSNYVEVVYEGYAPGGAAVLVVTLTDNRNRTAADVRNIFSKSGGNLGENGCVSYLFRKRGYIVFSAEKYNEDQILEAALEAGAEDVVTDGGRIEVICEPGLLSELVEQLEKANLHCENAEVANIPQSQIALDLEGSRRVIKLIEALDDHEDVQEVSTNLTFPDDLGSD